MLHTVELLRFIQFEDPTFVQITYEFFSTLDFTLKIGANRLKPEFYATLKFCMFDIDHKLSLDEFGRL